MLKYLKTLLNSNLNYYLSTYTCKKVARYLIKIGPNDFYWLLMKYCIFVEVPWLRVRVSRAKKVEKRCFFLLRKCFFNRKPAGFCSRPGWLLHWVCKLRQSGTLHPDQDGRGGEGLEPEQGQVGVEGEQAVEESCHPIKVETFDQITIKRAQLGKGFSINDVTLLGPFLVLWWQT